MYKTLLMGLYCKKPSIKCANKTKDYNTSLSLVESYDDTKKLRHVCNSGAEPQNYVASLSLFYSFHLWFSGVSVMFMRQISLC